MLRFVLFLLSALILSTGCSHVRTIPVPESEGEWTSEVPKTQSSRNRMYVRQDEGKYVIKDEPYSLKSKKKDPELLGPQRTYDHTASTASTSRARTRSKAASGMTRQQCVSMIGQAKFDRYVQKYGGEKGALRRCLVLKRLRG